MSPKPRNIAKNASESQLKSVSPIKKKKKIENVQTNYSRYIYKILKQVHHNLTISTKAMNIMNSFMIDMFERLASEASRLVRHGRKKTLSTQEIQTAVKLELPGQLAIHADADARKAVLKYELSKK